LAHRTLRIHLILHAHEAHPQVVELLQHFQELGHTARKPVELMWLYSPGHTETRNSRII
jgi:hypothetical protein